MLEAILKKLAAIGINLLQGGENGGVNIKTSGKKITGIKFSNLFNNLFHFEIHNDNRTIVINHEKLKGKQRRALKHLLPELLDDVGAIINESSIPTVNAVLSELPKIHEAVKKLTPIIPPADIPLLNACVFLRIKSEKGECVDGLKSQIKSIYGTRGGNLANLCSAGYLENWFLPMYDELVRSNSDEPNLAKARFIEIYMRVLAELPWTEFVSGRISPDKFKAHIIDKMTRNIENGVRYMDIHSFGEKNVKKIVRVLPEIQKAIGANAVRVDREPTRIFVRLEIPRKL